MKLSDIIHQVLPGRTSLGLEITDTSIKLAEVVSAKNRQPEIRRVLTESLPPGVVEEGKLIRPLVVIQTLQTMIHRAGIKTKRVHMVAPSQMLMVRFLKMPDIPYKELSKVIDFEVKHNIHLPFENPYYDFMKLNGSNHSKGKRKTTAKLPAASEHAMAFNQAAAASDAGHYDLSNSRASLFDDYRQEQRNEGESPLSMPCDVMLVAAPKELIDSYKEAAEAAGLKPAAMEFKALSLFRLIEQEVADARSQTLLVLDINETASDMSIFHEGQLKITRSVPVSFAIMKDEEADATIKPGFDLFAEFEQPSDNDGYGQAIGELVHELERLMNFYRYTLNNRTQQFSALYISGDVENADRIAETLKSRFSQPVVMIPLRSLKLNHPQLHDAALRCSVPIGLAIRRDRT
ncbi:type IV pilus biogenesis protein PilM [Paenibacillus sp. MBLB4367]|uniref:type IV pilus biogenesis protein PilM n=1 Tax=Paenibacillus sp. MBLB4367 TaxID=3384767 RepID=UPI00390834D7